MLERDKILLSTQAHFFSYNATASGTCLSTNGISNESLQYRMITLPHSVTVSYTHLRAHETDLDLVCRLLLEKHKIL